MKYLQQFAGNAQYISYLLRGGVVADLKERLLGKVLSDNSINNKEPFIIEGKSDTEVNSLTIYFNGSTTATEVIPIYDSTSKLYSYKTFEKVTRVQVPTTTTELTRLNHTKDITNMQTMFNACNKLVYLDVSNWDTSKITSMYQMFRDCSSLTSLDLSHFDTSKVTNMSSMFYNCFQLTSLNLSNWDTSKITSMYQMFYNCSSLTSLDLSHFDTSKITSMYQMFRGCSSLASLDLSSFDTSEVTYTGYAFQNCQKLASLDLSSFDTSKVTYMSEMFASCSSLTSLDISNFNMSKVTNMSYMFSNCRSLAAINGAFSGIRVNLDLSDTKLTNVDNFFNGLDTIATTQTLTLPKTAVYTQEQVAAATSKGWTVMKKSA